MPATFPIRLLDNLLAQAVQHMLPELLTLDRLLRLAEATFLVASHRDHLKLRATITNDDVLESFFLLCQGCNSSSFTESPLRVNRCDAALQLVQRRHFFLAESAAE